MKLTEAQMSALTALAEHHGGSVSITMWGGKPFSGMPSGIRSTAVLDDLMRRQLVDMKYSGLHQHWSITETGRAALNQKDKSDE